MIPEVTYHGKYVNIVLNDLTILMLRAVEIYYRVAVVSGGIICPILFPYLGDWSLILAGLFGGTIGVITSYLLPKWSSNV